MSEENVEIVRRHIEAFLEDAPLSVSYLDPYVVVDRSRVGTPESGVAYGHEEVVRSVRRYIGAFEQYAYEVERVTDLGSGAIVAVVTEKGRGKSSGVPVQHSFASLYTLIDGKIARVTVFPSEEEALEAAGLSE
jgi:ketosteroid isomerase-like protein